MQCIIFVDVVRKGGILGIALVLLPCASIHVMSPLILSLIMLPLITRRSKQILFKLSYHLDSNFCACFGVNHGPSNWNQICIWKLLSI